MEGHLSTSAVCPCSAHRRLEEMGTRTVETRPLAHQRHRSTSPPACISAAAIGCKSRLGLDVALTACSSPAPSPGGQQGPQHLSSPALQPSESFLLLPTLPRTGAQEKAVSPNRLVQYSSTSHSISQEIPLSPAHHDPRFQP